jgi:hypothetical protein
LGYQFLPDKAIYSCDDTERCLAIHGHLSVWQGSGWVRRIHQHHNS